MKQAKKVESGIVWDKDISFQEAELLLQPKEENILDSFVQGRIVVLL